MSSSQRPWERAGGHGGGGQGQGLWGAKRRFVSRQSSTTSTSTSRSSGLLPDHAGAEGDGGNHSNASIADTLLESMELLGARGNLDLADKIYLEKIFHRVLDWNNGMPVSSATSSNAMDKHFWGSVQQMARDDQRDANSPRSHMALKEKLENLTKGENSPLKSKPSLSPRSVASPNTEKRRRRDLIIPDDEEASSASYRNHKSSNPVSKQGPLSRTASYSSRDTSRSKDYSGPESVSKYSYLSSMSSLSMDNGSLRGSPQGSMAPPAHHPNLSTFLPAPLRLSGSFESTASPPDTYMFNQPYTTSHAERVLMGLGFGATEGFLPERFLRDWYMKISKAQMEAQMAAQAELKTPEPFENPPAFGPTGSQQNLPSDANPDLRPAHRRDSHVSTVSSILDEAASYLPASNSQDSKIQRLKEYIAAYSNNTQSPTEGRDFKVRHFATSRQKSLPLYLETLSEEEEGRSRISGVDPFDKEARLQMFISDAMSSSGKSTGSNSENSYISSNQSESDSMSSCSEKRSHSSQQLHIQHQHAYKRHLAEQKQLEKNRRQEEDKTGEKSSKGKQLGVGDDETRKVHPKKSPVRQVTVRRNENIGVKSETEKNVDVGQTKQPQKANDNEAQPSIVKDKVKNSVSQSLNQNPQIRESMQHSKDSLEVEDIMQNQSTRGGRAAKAVTGQVQVSTITAGGDNVMSGNVEPAMVSIVLEDVDRDVTGSGYDTMMSMSYLGLPASRCSSSSLSPIPQSPVTVIEVGLDNQQDSLDTEGTGSSKETDDDVMASCTTASEGGTIKKMRRSKSRCSGSYKHSSPEDFYSRRNSGAASPVPCFLNRASPSSEYRELQPRRRLSLEVPLMPEVRQMLDRQRALSVNQICDNYQEHEPPRRDSRRRASFSEEDPIIINDVLAEHVQGTQGETDSSPGAKTAVKRKNSGEVVEKTTEVKAGIDINHNGSREATVHNAGQLQRTGSQTEDKCQCCSEAKMSHQNSNGVETPTNSEKPQFDFSVSRSNESSPGSAKSAFRVATRSRKDVPSSGYFSEVSETDIDEFPKGVMPVIPYNPRLISSISKTLQSQGSDADTPKKETEDRNLVTSPTLTFSDSRPSVRDIRSGQGTGNRVYSISRAVQVNDMAFNQRHPYTTHHHHHHPHLQHGVSRDSDYYLACDREVQCSLECYNISDRNYSEIGFGKFHKFTQTGVPTFEISCQTNVSDDDVTNHESVSEATGCSARSESRAVNTVVSLIGREHINEMTASSPGMAKTDFQLVDETLKLIEDELSIIDAKETIRNILSTKILSGDNSSRPPRPDLDPIFRGRIASTPNRQLPTARLEQLQHRTKSLSADERLPARFAPSTWMDATKLYTSLDDSVDVRDGWTIKHVMRVDEDSVFSDRLPGSQKYGAPTERWLPLEEERVSPDKESRYVMSRSDSHTIYNTRNLSIEAGERSAFYNPRVPSLDDYNEREVVKSRGPGSGGGSGSSSEDYPTVSSQGLMVKMFELQQGLTSSLNPKKDDSETDGSADLHDDTVGVRSESLDLYDFTNENVNTSFRFQTQSKVSEWRRFSLPILEQRASSKRGHSKLSRLKYQKNSSQNSYKSLDLETDFMQASEPLGSLGTRSVNRTVSISSETKPSELRLGRTRTDFPSRNTDGTKVFEDSVARVFNNGASNGSQREVTPEVEAGVDLLKTTLKADASVSKMQKPTSPLMAALRETHSTGSVGSGKSTPEILISPLRAFQVDFLQVPGSPKDYLTKAAYPSVSVSPTSPHSISPLAEVTRVTKDTTSDSHVFTFGKSRSDWGKSRKEFLDLRRASMAESDVQASTIGSTTDLSRKSSVEHSADEFSDASMLPRLSIDSALDELKTEEDEVEIKVDIDDIGVEGKSHLLREAKSASPDFHLDILKIKPEPVEFAASSPAEESRQDSLDVEHASNRSLDGSEADRDLDNLDIGEYELRVSSRPSSASSYSDAILDMVETLSQDSLSCDEGKPTMNYLTVDDHTDELLQVSDYGGVSPSPTHMKRDFREDSFSPARTEWTAAESYPAPPRHGAPTTTRKRVKTISKSPNDASDSDDENYDAANERRERARARFSRDRRNSRDNWDVVQSVLLWQSREDDFSQVLTVDEEPLTHIVIKQGSPVKAEVSKDVDSSGDECDKEILRINLKLPLRGRLVKMTSDPVDKDMYCLAVKQTSLKNMSPVPELKEEVTPTKTAHHVDIVKSEVQDPGDAVITVCENKTTGLLEMFQNADLSDLQQITKFVGDPDFGHTCFDDFEGLPTISRCSEHFDNCVTAHIVDVEFTDDDDKALSGSQQNSLDDPCDLIDDIEMLALFKKIDEFGQGSSLVQEESTESSPRRFPLSQISEEETMSEDTASDGSRGYNWSVRSRFIRAQENAEFNSFTHSESPRSPNITGAEGFTDAGEFGCPEIDKELSRQPSVESANEVTEYSFNNSKRVALQRSSSGNNLELIDQHFSERICQSSHHHSSESDGHIDLAHSQLESIPQQSFVCEFDSIQEKSLARQIVEPVESSERDNGFITQQYSESDEVFTQDIIENVTDNGQGIRPSVENSIFSRTDDLDHVDIKIRAVSPSSKIFDFAQSLIEKSIKADNSVNESLESISHTESISDASISQPTSTDHSFDVYSLSPLSGSPKSPAIETHTVEKKIDMFGNITTRFSSTHTMRFNNLNLQSEQCSPQSSLSGTSSPRSSLSGPSSPQSSPRSGVGQAEEKHVSTVSINIGDYRKKEKKKRSELDVNVFEEELTDTSAANIVTDNNLTEKSVTNNELPQISNKVPMTSHRRNRILKAFKKTFSTDGNNAEHRPPSTAKDSSLQLDSQVNTGLSPEDLKDRVRSMFLLGGDGNGEINSGLDNEVIDGCETIDVRNKVPTEDVQGQDCKISPQYSFAEEDLKSRVKAMFLIETTPKSVPTHSDQSPDDGSQTLPRNHRVKVTTMFSRNSKEARTSFTSTSISEYEDSPEELLVEPPSAAPLSEGLRNIRTQLSSRTRSVPDNQQAPTTKKQRPRSLRTRDSLLKLHEQPNVSSSVGSDTDSELTSALRNQGDYDIRERDLALRRFSSDVIDEEDAGTHTGAAVEDSESPASENPGAVETDAMVRPTGKTLTCPAKEVQNPRVVIQQPSEDSQTTQDNLRKVNLPLLNAPAFASPVSGLPDHEDQPSGGAKLSDINDSKHRYSSNHGPSSTWRRRFPRMQFLSPNAALAQKKRYDYIQPRESYTRVSDESHPELSYLDILPKFGQPAASEPSRYTVQQPGSPTFRYTMTSPEPKPAGNDEYDSDKITVSGDFSIVLQADYSDEVKEFAEQAIRGDDENPIRIGATNTGGESYEELSKFNVEELDINVGAHSAGSDVVTEDQGEYGDNNGSILDLLVFGPTIENSNLTNLLDTSSNSSMAINSNDSVNEEQNATEPHEFGETTPETLDTSLTLMTSHPPDIDALFHRSGPRFTESLRPCSESGDDLTDAFDGLHVVTHAKKLLSVTSHDSGFDSQGSPIDLASGRVMELTLSSFGAVKEETKSDLGNLVEF